MERESYWARVFDEKARVEQDPARRLCFSSEANRQSIYEAVMAFVDGRFDRVLDAGAGDGELSLRLKQKANFVAALDISCEMIRLARRRVGPGDPSIGLCRGSFVTPPFRSGTFDLIVASEALQHAPFFPTLFRLVELLRPGGTLVVSMPHKGHPIIQEAQRRRGGMFHGIGAEELGRLGEERGVELWVRPLFLEGHRDKGYVFGPVLESPSSARLHGANRIVLKIKRRA
jgi:SAM-dependent methyltransferase